MRVPSPLPFCRRTRAALAATLVVARQNSTRSNHSNHLSQTAAEVRLRYAARLGTGPHRARPTGPAYLTVIAGDPEGVPARCRERQLPQGDPVTTTGGRWCTDALCDRSVRQVISRRPGGPADRLLLPAGKSSTVGVADGAIELSSPAGGWSPGMATIGISLDYRRGAAVWNDWRAQKPRNPYGPPRGEPPPNGHANRRCTALFV